MPFGSPSTPCARCWRVSPSTSRCGARATAAARVVREEAHRYMPADPRLGFAPTRHALSRIAEEGRKYGCYLGVVTQRPGELDPTILSQCSTIFAMRLANEHQAIIRSAIANSSASSLSFLSSMGQREAIAFGEGVATTMRMRFERLDPALIPGPQEARGRGAGRERRRHRPHQHRRAAGTCRNRRATSPSPSRSAHSLQPGDPGYRKPETGRPRGPCPTRTTWISATA